MKNRWCMSIDPFRANIQYVIKCKSDMENQYFRNK